MKRKVCGKCGQEKSVSEFYKSKRDGYRSRCKECHKKDCREYAKTGYYARYQREYSKRGYVKERMKGDSDLGYQAKWYQKKKLGILLHYSNGSMKCAFCGFDDIRALSIDHIDGGGAPHRRMTGNDVYGWLKRNGFPEGYQVLCANCQWIKRQVNRECYIR